MRAFVLGKSLVGGTVTGDDFEGVSKVRFFPRPELFLLSGKAGTIGGARRPVQFLRGVSAGSWVMNLPHPEPPEIALQGHTRWYSLWVRTGRGSAGKFADCLVASYERGICALHADRAFAAVPETETERSGAAGNSACMRIRTDNRIDRFSTASVELRSGLCLSKLLQEFLERAASICSHAASGRSSRSLELARAAEAIGRRRSHALPP